MDNQGERPVLSTRAWGMMVAGTIIFFCITIPVLVIFFRTLPFMQPLEPTLGTATMLSLIVAVPTVIVGIPIGAGLWLWHHGRIKWLLARKVNPTPNNTYAAIYEGKGRGFAQPTNGEQPFLPNLQTLHNAPRITGIREEPRDEPLAGDTPQLERAAPRLDDFYDAIPYNSLQTGLGAKLGSGELVTASIADSVHYKLIGGSGFGKSCLAAGVLDIATTTNSPDMLRIALLDLEWKTARLFEHLPHVLEVRSQGRTIRMIGRDADEVAARLGTLKQELNRRAHNNIEKPLLLIYVEEMLSLQYEVDPALQKQMLADLNILAIRGRKYGIYFLACMQVDYSTKELREAKGQFRTRAGFAIDTKAATASGFVNTPLVKENFMRGRPGQYLLEKPAFSELVLAPRFDVEQKLTTNTATTSRLSHDFLTTDEIFFDTPGAIRNGPVEPIVATNNTEMSTRSIKVLEMLRDQRGQNEIIKELWNVTTTSGKSYRDAVAEYRQIVASLVARGGGGGGAGER